MTVEEQNEARKWMEENILNYTNEYGVAETEYLAEDCARYFDQLDWCGDWPVWDLAAEVCTTVNNREEW
jgi:hypothetical protein